MSLNCKQTPQPPLTLQTETDFDFDLEESDLLPSLDINSELMGLDFLSEVDWLASSLQPTLFHEPMDDVLEL
jgi:hypothetical protein